jgi:hypothetical protein
VAVAVLIVVLVVVKVFPGNRLRGTQPERDVAMRPGVRVPVGVVPVPVEYVSAHRAEER